MALDINRPVSLVKTLALFHGESWLSWTPETVQLVLERQFKYVPDEIDLNKVEALRETLRSDQFLSNALLFEKLARAFAGLPFTATVWEPLSASDLAFGIHVLGRIAGAEKLGGASESVLAYIAACLEDDNIIWGPPVLGFDVAQDEIEGASQAEHALVDDCALLWPLVEVAYFSTSTPEAFMRAASAVVNRYVVTGSIDSPGYDPDRQAPAERRAVVARSLVACIGVLVGLAARDAAPKSAVVVSAARARRLALKAA